MSFEARYKQLNPAQREAVDSIDGPVMVVAGPGTGKTELLSMRAANILRLTDTLAENILCMTFTDSGADAMRERLVEIIGKDAYKVAIHTFHSFGSEIINQNSEFFYNGAPFRAADELTCYEILRSIFDELEYDNILSSKMNGDYTYLRDALTVISELKKSSLTSGELLAILDANDEALDRLENDLATIFAQRIGTTTLSLLVPVAHTAAALETPRLPAGVTPLGNIIATSLAHAIDDAQADDSTKPITAWKNHWLEKDADNRFVFKDRRRQQKLRAMSHIYDRYISRMQEDQLFDFDDMIMQVVHAIETHPDLKYNLQEKYQYIMVDEFQDTNLAQARILSNLTDNEVHAGRPNILVVGDDDQAIYSFQGADVSNILNFKDAYRDVKRVILTDNYRSAGPILEAARTVITQGSDRLERYVEDIDKSLTAHHKQIQTPALRRIETATKDDEIHWLISDIQSKINRGQPAGSITVLARRHHELIALLPYFAEANIAVNYERRENVLDDETVRLVETAGTILLALMQNDLDTVNGMLPEFIAHPAFGFEAKELWNLSLNAYKERRPWLDIMATLPRFLPLHSWLIETARDGHHLPLEYLLDAIIGKPSEEDNNGYRLPFYDYFFSKANLTSQPDAYLAHLEALQAIRRQVREYRPDDVPTLASFIESIRLHRQTNTAITAVRHRLAHDSDAVNLMTAHKSKGLEFASVYIIGATDAAWGEKARARSRMISYPENLTLAPAGASIDERLRLFFVAMTRAKDTLTITNATTNESGKDTPEASFLLPFDDVREEAPSSDIVSEQLDAAERMWYGRLTAPLTRPLRDILGPMLSTYKLSATHLNQFLDVAGGGPEHFLINSLLHFPSAMSPAAAYGSAIHATLQHAHNHVRANGELRPEEDSLHDFERALREKHLTTSDFESLYQRGCDALRKFLSERQSTFASSQRPEANFSHQQVHLGEAHITGVLDLIDVDTEAKTVVVTDYKTGAPARSWQGKSDYEKIKLHKYKQQLMFYKLLVEHSRDFAGYTVIDGILQFVEPTRNGDILELHYECSQQELDDFQRLIGIVWQKITTLELPDTSQYEPSYKGMLAFEYDLLHGAHN